MRIQNLEKIVINTGVGRLKQSSSFDENIMPNMLAELAAITGQKAQNRPARKSIAGFKVREGSVVGFKTTLRGKRMRDFLYRMVNVALPRVRDFRGIDPKQIDKGGNLTIGFRDHTVFPEILPEDSKFDFGFQVTLVPRIKDKEEAYKLYKELGVPLQDSEDNKDNG